MRIYNSTSNREVTLPNDPFVSLGGSQLVFDGDPHVYMIVRTANSAVHVWSVNGQYEYQLFNNNDHFIRCLAINKQHSYMYLGTRSSLISIFTVQY